MRRTTLLDDYRRQLLIEAKAGSVAGAQTGRSLFLRNAALIGMLGALYGGAFFARSAQLLPW